MGKTVEFNDVVVNEIANLETTYTFSQFCQMAVREEIMRRKEGVQ